MMKVVIGLCEILSWEKTQTQSRSSSTPDETQGDFTGMLSCSVEARLNATNGTLMNPNGVRQSFSRVLGEVLLMMPFKNVLSNTKVLQFRW